MREDGKPQFQQVGEEGVEDYGIAGLAADYDTEEAGNDVLDVNFDKKTPS